jgi:hypothetical protein
MVNLYKTITSTTQVASTECYLDGVELAHTANTSLKVYDESVGAAAAGKLVSTTMVTAYNRENFIKFPKPGLKMSGIYAVWDAGVGTIYYHY